MRTINLLVALDQNYLPPLRILLTSLFVNNPGEAFHIYLLHDGIPEEDLARLADYCALCEAELFPIRVPEELFADAPVHGHLTRAMYYRLLACELLPDTLERALYLDPDTLVINPLRTLYDTDLGGRLFAACAHTEIGNLSGRINRVRLRTPHAAGYFNSGVLLMNLALQREQIRADEIFAYVREHKNELILPDQDILNGLYGERILPLDDSLYNYDAHRYEMYRAASGGEKDLAWVVDNTVILHFCGRNKPWIKPGRSRFGVLHRHYAALTERVAAHFPRRVEAR